jgi:hypothetical protein
VREARPTIFKNRRMVGRASLIRRCRATFSQGRRTRYLFFVYLDSMDFGRAFAFRQPA